MQVEMVEMVETKVMKLSVAAEAAEELLLAVEGEVVV